MRRSWAFPGVGRRAGLLGELRHVVKTAERGERLPSEHILLRDARASNLRGDFRRAVLDAATAGEMSLAALLDRATVGAPQTARDVGEQRQSKHEVGCRHLEELLQCDSEK